MKLTDFNVLTQVDKDKYMITVNLFMNDSVIVLLGVDEVVADPEPENFDMENLSKFLLSKIDKDIEEVTDLSQCNFGFTIDGVNIHFTANSVQWTMENEDDKG